MGKKKIVEIASIRSVLDGMEQDVEKFNSGQNAAGTRLRKAAQSIKVLAQGLRNSVTEIRNAR